MRRFAFRALDAHGAGRSGVLHAYGPRDVDAWLLGEGLQPVAVTEAAANEDDVVGRQEERLVLLKALATYLNAGLQVHAALGACGAALRSREVRGATEQARRLVAEGNPIASSLHRCGLVSGTDASILASGESAGQFTAVLAQVVTHTEQALASLASLRRALVYPAVLLVTGGASILVILLIVFPRLAAVVALEGAELPFAARQLLAISSFARGNWLVLLGTTTLAVAWVWRWARKRRNRVRLRDVMSRLPFFRGIMQARSASALTRSLGMMLETGVPLMRALQTLRAAAAGDAERGALTRLIERTAAGEKLTAALRAEEMIPGSVTPMLVVGEATARMAEMLMHVGDDLDRESQSALDTALTLAQPMLVLVFGGLVAAVAGGMLQTLYNLRPAN